LAPNKAEKIDKKENPLVSIFFNIALPVMILNQLTKRMGENGPLVALLVALAFPIGYAIWDYLQRRHKSWVALFGVINILLTGGLALFKLEGFWFAVKEAAFPFILGTGVFFSSYTKKPLMKIIADNLDVLDKSLIENRLEDRGKQDEYFLHLRKSTRLFASSFFISSVLNFILAAKVFSYIDPQLSELEHSAALNDQIARMTWMGFVVIALPLMLFSMAVIWHLLKGIRHLTGLSYAEIFPHDQIERPPPS
ncbi:MAG: hypothetical protein KDD35_08570, partial [Bdellovibrionales bacterium]|nr:hypothetical protein [Bdellovibrionales bacterium]